MLLLMRRSRSRGRIDALVASQRYAQTLIDISHGSRLARRSGQEQASAAAAGLARDEG